MSDTEKRLLWRDGKQTTLRFDAATWQAIDLIATRAGQRWTDWARAAIAAHPNAVNMHATLREVAMQTLLEQQFIEQRAEHATGHVPPLMEAAGTLDDEQLVEELRTALIEYGPVELGGFVVRAGANSQDRACIWIENMVKGWPHYAIPLPFTLAEVAAKVDAA